MRLAAPIQKRLLLSIYHGISPKYLQKYLKKFAFRSNRTLQEPQLLQ
ncbi:MAG: transposase [Candidatus Nitrosoglobus sp.]